MPWTPLVPTDWDDFSFVDGAKVTEQIIDNLQFLFDNLQTLFPVGTIVPSGRGSAPSGYLMCDGLAVSRTTFSDLFGAIGTVFGIGDGSTTFNLPDLRQKFPLGVAVSGTGSALGETGGVIDHVHTGPSHVHAGPSHTHSGPSHTHSVNIGSFSTGLDGSHGHSASSDGAVKFTSPGGHLFTGNQAVLEEHEHAISVLAAGNHSHGVDPPSTNSGAGGSGNTGAGGTQNTGASGTANTGIANPPFLAVNYMIKATVPA